MAESVRKPTETRITKELANAKKKFKTVNPMSTEGRNLKKRIKRLEGLSTPVSQKFTGTGKTIGDNKTKTGQYKEKTPEVKTPFFKLKDDPSKRLREKRLALEKANKEKLRKTRLKKSAKEMGEEFKQPQIDKEKLRKDIKTYPHKSETSVDDAKTHMIRLKAQGRNAAVTGDERGSTVVLRPGSLGQDAINRAKAALAERTKKKTPSGDKPGMRIGSQAAVPYSRLLSEKGRKVKKTRKGTGFDKTAVAPKPPKKVVVAPKPLKKKVKKLSDVGKYVEKFGDRRIPIAKVDRGKPGRTIGSQVGKRKPVRKGIADPLAVSPKPLEKVDRGKPGRIIGSQVGKRKPVRKGIADPLAVSPKPPKKVVVAPKLPKKLAKIIPRRKPTAKKDMTPAELNQFKQAKAPVSLGSAKTYGGELTSKGTGAGKMGGRPEDRSQRKDYEDFLSSKGGIKGFQFNLFGKNKTQAEASKAAKESYDAEQEDRKKASQQDFYQYGEGRRSLLKKGGQVKKVMKKKVTKGKKKKVGKKEQGYKARKDESIAMRVKKKRTKKQLKASRSDSYGKFGSGKGKGKINRSGAALVAASYD